ncbi:MAG: SPFH domain-containing protein [Thermoanaerobaculia bacterium]|nr:SPFH domain-containing protein [Thermoanaerobaculia bacterium]
MDKHDFKTVREHRATTFNGFLVLSIVIALLAAAIWRFVTAGMTQTPGPAIEGGVLMLVFGFLAAGFFTVQPNEARVLIFFGRYVGTCREEGFRWGNPFAFKRHVSLRVRNLNSEKIKVNDASGSPIEIAAVIVWRVIDSAKALFDVDNYEQFVQIQVETAVRSLATGHPYDPRDAEGNELSLRGDQEKIAAELREMLQERLRVAGVDIHEARLTHLAYAPEIAQAMLRRQQAQAVVAARRLIVEAAVGMVDDALRALSQHKIVELDEERKAAMVNNLMVVLTSEQSAAPVLNTGTLYG